MGLIKAIRKSVSNRKKNTKNKTVRTGPSELDDAKASAIMSSEWDKRADQNAFLYINSAKNDWLEDDFFATSHEALFEVKSLLPKNFKFDGTILDVGCGVGRISFEFAKTASQVIGLDVSGSMIEKANCYAEKFRVPNVRFYVTDGLTYPMVNSDSVDFIYCVRVMQHVPTLSVIQANLSECARVLKSGGWLIFMTQDNFDPDGKNPTYDGVRCGRKEIAKLAKGLPLKIRRFGKDGALAYFTLMQK